MKASAKSNLLPLLAMGAGIVCIALRFLLYAFGFDHRGLMNSWHFLHIACLIIAAALAVYTGLTLRKQTFSPAYKANFPANRQWTGIGVLIPVWFLVSAFSTVEQITDKITVARTVLAFAAVPCFALTCWCRVQGKRPNFLLHGLLCVFFAVDMICRYRPWSGNPQLPDYTFQLLACIFLTLTAYYRMAFDVDLPSPKLFRFCSLMAIFFCMASFVGGEDAKFYMGGTIWALFGIAHRTHAPRHLKPREEA